MRSSSKCFESSKKVKCDEGIDRINSLPDKILVHILSFLPTKHAVGSSILSRRWRYLFTLLTNFDFDETLTFGPNDHIGKLAVAKARILQSLGIEGLKWCSTFKDFVDRVLMLCKSTHISSFRLKCGLGFDCSNVNSWKQVALHRGVTELDISTLAYESSVLPLSLFVCETLVSLKIGGEFEMKFPACLLPHLKTLQLHSVTFSEACSLNRLISGCPVLEDLVLAGSWQYVETINISCPWLTSLTMDFSDIFMSCYHRTSVVLDLPNLLHFNYVDYLAEKYCIKNIKSLKDARIDILLDIENADWLTFSDSVLGLMNGVSSARHLYLSELGWSRCINWRDVLPDILHSSPMLEHLVFPEILLNRVLDDDYEDKKFWSRLRKSPYCLSSSLKTITIDCFHGFNEELEIAKYLVRHGKVLTKLIIYWQISSKKEYQDLMKLLKIGRLATKECAIEVGGY
ncbi:F-box protein At4g22280-like [Chenopodium quinoa]|uniref:F-box domain-containing protein n=1 Tax=Chenopodium quinoa TaxID=63459 RepID=A0A803LEQ0_CHEQI|nr:F-box protein At4g22280-like [Chenopodium quinoa]